MRYRKNICALVFLSIFSIAAIFGQNQKAELTVKIDQIISSDFPSMKAYVVVQNAKGETVGGLSPALFSTRIDSLEIKGKTKISPFTLNEEPIDYTILFSNNGVMDGEPLDFQKNAILQFVDLLKENDVLSLYSIGTEATVVFEEQKKADIDLALVNDVAVTSEQPRIYDSLINVLRRVERRKIARKVVLVMSDGRDQNSRFTKEQLSTALTETGIPIYAIGIRVLNNQSLSNLNEFSVLTGGTYVYSASVKKIPDNLISLMDIITHCYTINYSIKNLKADNLVHHLEVSVNERDAQGKGQKTFVAVKVPIPKWVRWLLFGAAVLCIVVIIIVHIIRKIQLRRRMGITRRKCPECRSIMKDSWDTCPFCKYVPSMKKKKKGKKEP